MSWTGTVRCGHCYESGHNVRGCHKLESDALAAPNSWAAEKWKGIVESKKKVKLCSYCKEPKHTRRTCTDLKENKATYIADGILWRKAFTKWLSDKGIGPGALIKTHCVYRVMDSDGSSTQVYTTDDKYERPVAYLVSVKFPDSHLVGNPYHYNWAQQLSGFQLEGKMMKSGIDKRWSGVSLDLPRIPAINPSKGVTNWGLQDETTLERSRIGRYGSRNKWDIISPSPKSFQPCANWAETASALCADDFFDTPRSSRRDRAEKSDFLSFDEDHRFVMQMYVDGDITIDQLRDPKVIDPNASGTG